MNTFHIILHFYRFYINTLVAIFSGSEDDSACLRPCIVHSSHPTRVFWSNNYFEYDFPASYQLLTRSERMGRQGLFIIAPYPLEKSS